MTPAEAFLPFIYPSLDPTSNRQIGLLPPRGGQIKCVMPELAGLLSQL